MKAATIKDLQTELECLDAEALKNFCLRLARFKKENKELLTYLLFESFDESAFVRSINQETDDQFADMNLSQLYFVKKTLRKILRNLGKYARYTASAEMEVQMLLHFCHKLKETGIELSASTVIHNLYRNQLKKINKLIAGFHEDLRYDYQRELNKID